MNDADLTALAVEAGLASPAEGWGVTMMLGETQDALPALRRFTDLVIEACAMQCDTEGAYSDMQEMAQRCGEAVRRLKS